ncbi:T7SS effector LXG polymorphic toxin [uncultured Rossellomorea sp.]|uniref:T7SS effector LXG polymorphic toxin n=1 Tax=uncultured Rossellomorea sp. TaxID=2837549 RepID=UPI002623BB58|nr:T7SS effector LXG polymorphic toxin [uncultured Rossellomorea sp.]
MKVYEAPTLLDAMSSRRHEYETLRDQLLTLKSSFQAIVELDDEFQGKGADAIKGFYGAQINVVEIWIQLAESNIAFFNGIQGDAEGRNLGRETVELPFLEEDLHQSERRSGEMIAAQQQELQRILNRISDIQPLNVFSRDRFDTHMEEARRQREDTLDSVNRFDEELKREYQHLEVSEQILSGLMRELMESSRQGSHISPLYFNAAAYYSSDAYKLTDDITAQSDSYLKFKESQEQAREPKPIPEEEINENPITESLNSFKEIGQDLWAGMEKRNEDKFDSVYDFGNYITAGGLDVGKGFTSGLKERAEVATDSGSDFINYLTMGGMDLFNGAVNPDDTYSKEHWLNSFGLAALLVGGAKPGLKAKGGTNISTPAPKTVPKVSLNHRWDQIRLRIDDLYNRPMMVADNGMLVGGEPGWSRLSVDKAVNEREIGTGDRVGTKDTAKVDKDASEVGKHVDDVKIPENMKKWDYPPSKELFKKYEDVYKNPEYYDQNTGEIHWPPNDGFVMGTQRADILHYGTVLDRYGNPSGSFLAPESDSFPSRALAPHSEKAPYYVYEVIDDFEVTIGEIAPWFDQPGGGTQIIKYKSNGRPYSIEELIELGFIKQTNP